MSQLSEFELYVNEDISPTKIDNHDWKIDCFVK